MVFIFTFIALILLNLNSVYNLKKGFNFIPTSWLFYCHSITKSSFSTDGKHLPPLTPNLSIAILLKVPGLSILFHLSVYSGASAILF